MLFVKTAGARIANSGTKVLYNQTLRVDAWILFCFLKKWGPLVYVPLCDVFFTSEESSSVCAPAWKELGDEMTDPRAPRIKRLA